MMLLWSDHGKCQCQCVTANKTSSRLDDKTLRVKVETRLVLDQNSSKVHDRYTTSLYTF